MLLNDRQIFIIQSLLYVEHMTISSMAKQSHISRQTIYDDLSMIESWLNYYKIGMLVKDHRGAYSIEGSRQAINHILFESSELFEFYNVEQRHCFILYQLVCNPFITIDKLMALTSVSKTTIVSDIQDIKVALTIENISLSYYAKQYLFEGEEYHIRSVLINMLSPYAYKLVRLSSFCHTALDDFLFLLNESSMLALDIARVAFFVQYKRMLIGCTVSEVVDTIYQLDLDDVASLLGNYFSTYSNFEQQYSLILVKSFFRFTHALDSMNHYCKQIIEQLILAFASILNNNFDQKATLHLLYYHFEPAVYRLSLGIVLQNPIFNQIVSKYAQAYQLACLSMKQMIHHPTFIYQEASYLVILLLSQHIIEDYRHKPIVVVCYEGMSISQALKQQLIAMSLDPSLITCVTFDKLTLVKGDYILISTLMPKNLPMNTTVVIVHPILTTVDKVKIIASLNIEMQLLVDSKTLLGIVKTHVDEKTYVKIVNQSVLKQAHPTLIQQRRDYMLKDLLTESTIQFATTVNSWQDAVNLAAKPLLLNNSITSQYVEQVIANVSLNGPYIVLKDGFALPHAKASAAVHCVAMSLLILETPVSFSNDDQHLVNVIVLLAATDPQSHLNALSELVTLVGDDALFERLQSARDISSVLNLI